MAIDFTLTDSQLELQKNAKDFAEGVLRPITNTIDRAADGWESFLAGRGAYREMARDGFTKSFIPVDYGGAGFSMLYFALAAEELARVDVNVPTTLLGSGLGLQPVIQYGTPEQKERFLRPFAEDPEGDLLASYAFTDVAGGANFDSPDPGGGIQTLARRDGDQWVITGEKHYTTNGTGWDKKVASSTRLSAAPIRERALMMRSPSLPYRVPHRASRLLTSTTRSATGVS